MLLSSKTSSFIGRIYRAKAMATTAPTTLPAPPRATAAPVPLGVSEAAVPEAPPEVGVGAVLADSSEPPEPPEEAVGEEAALLPPAAVLQTTSSGVSAWPEQIFLA